MVAIATSKGTDRLTPVPKYPILSEPSIQTTSRHGLMVQHLSYFNTKIQFNQNEDTAQNSGSEAMSM